MEQLTDLSFWKKKLGHLPIRLIPSVEGKYILLNGLNGNFCIHFTTEAESKNTYFSQSWSSNTKNFLAVNNESVKLFNWQKDNPLEQIPLQTVLQNFDKFYKYLISTSAKSNRDIVPVVLDIFRQFRSITAEEGNPVQALNYLFILLAGLEDDIYSLDTDKWGISRVNIPHNFESFIERFKDGIGEIVPDLNLILRHSAGALFQEAQKEITQFNTQLNLFGTYSGTIITKGMLYSSIHYTPSFLARSIVENSLKLVDLTSLVEIRILDPACGSSEFLIETLKQLKDIGYSGHIYITGFDISQTAINTSSFLLAYEKRTVWGDMLSYHLKCVSDSLIEEWDYNYTMIVTNPPFISWELLENKDQKETIREILGQSFNSKPNLASAFFYKSIKHLAPNGVLGCVIPSTLLTLNSYKKLREEISTIFELHLIGKLGNFVFENALTDASIIVGIKQSNPVSQPVFLWTRNEKEVVNVALKELRKSQFSNESVKEKIEYSIYQPVKFPIIEDSWKLISYTEYELFSKLNYYISLKKLFPVNDLFDVIQGIRPGNKTVFIINKDQYSELPENEKEYFSPSIDNDAVKNGAINIKNYTWYPYNKKNGELLFVIESELEENVPIYYSKFLLPAKTNLVNRKKKVPHWWCLSDRAPRLLPLKPSIVSAEFGNSSSFALDLNNQFIAERAYAWRPRKTIEKNDFYFYLSIFSSPFFDKLISVYSKELAGGKWYDLGKNQTKNIPIPNVHMESVKNSDQYRSLVELGKRLAGGDFYIRAVLNDFVMAFYPKE